MRPQSAHNLPRGSLTHILVNPLNLDDTAFNAWLDRLVENSENPTTKKAQKPQI